MKIMPEQTGVEIAQWNYHCRKTTYVKDWADEWSVYEIMSPIDVESDVSVNQVEKSVTVMVPPE